MYGARIRERRKKVGLTMKELGEKINVAESTISGYESETRKPDIDTLKKLAKVLDTNSSYLLGETDDPTPLDEKARSEENILFFDVDGLDEEGIEEVKKAIEYQRWRAEQKRNQKK
jgi:transcriptional regulator with XRE-family HTH domain